MHTRCKATNRQGRQCGNAAVPGAVCCRMHGAAAPQVLARARQRLAEAADPAAARLVALLDHDDVTAQHRAAVAILDRAGIGTKATVELAATVDVTVKAQAIVAVIVGTLTDLGLTINDDVRAVVARHLQAASASAQDAVGAPDG